MTLCSLTSSHSFFQPSVAPPFFLLITVSFFLVTRRHYCRAVLKNTVFMLCRRSTELDQFCDFIRLRLTSSDMCASICICRIKELFRGRSVFSVMLLSFYACAEVAQLKKQIVTWSMQRCNILLCLSESQIAPLWYVLSCIVYTSSSFLCFLKGSCGGLCNVLRTGAQVTSLD